MTHKLRRVDDASPIHHQAVHPHHHGKRFAVHHRLAIHPTISRLAASPAVNRCQRGMTLVELVITIVIIGIAAAALFSATASITARSADPMLGAQSLHLAESLMEEMQSVPFNAIADIAPREPQYRDGSGIEALENYSVGAVVSDYSIGGQPGKRIDVDVTDPTGRTLRLTGYRTEY